MSVNPTLFKSQQLNESVVKKSTKSMAVGQLSPRSSQSVEYRITYALVFVVCLSITCLSRFLPRSWHPWIIDEGKTNTLWGEARSAADSTVPYIFHQ